MAGSEALLVLSTCENSAEAERLAEALVGQRLAACVNLVPGVKSVYRWQGGVERGDEVLMVIKTSRERLEAVEEAIQTLSSYDVPEVLAVPVAGGSAAYLEWVAESVRVEE
jgi:periplasmic divalent cation tolerance protein